jgi:primosomal protein N' (replication factor Y)
MSQFLPSNFSLRTTHISSSPPAAHTSQNSWPSLTKQQAQALNTLNNPSHRSFLLHGDTGTGKTRLYIEVARDSLAVGKNVLILTPEIGLTSQLAQTFRGSLPYPVLILHSNLTDRQRRELWLQILFATSPIIVIGPRSALFAPFQNLGLVVVDEAHDGAYKQDQAPHYQALRVAGKLAEIHKAKLILGSATPPVSEYYIMQSKHLPIIRLTEPAAGPVTPVDITVVESRDRQQYSKHPYLSDIFLDKITEALSQHSQSLIFLNRRGTARIVLCQNCGWQALCPRCDLPLTYHGDSHTMRCHTCGFAQTGITNCPVCASTDLAYKSIGTKAVAASLQSLFPNARLRRFDTDNTKSEKFEDHYQSIKEGGADILIGTQMLVKGLDLPHLGMVGIVAADSSLYFPDYTAEEQTYQLLSQVMGRVGRGHRKGTVVIQTYDRDGKSLQAVLNKNWDEFYAQQIAEREQFMFPPFVFLLKLICSRKTRTAAMSASKKLFDGLQHSGLKIEVIGPSPRFNERSSGNYSWQLVVKAKERKELVKALDYLPANWTYDLDPLTLL